MGVPQDTGEVFRPLGHEIIEPVCYWLKVIEEHEMTSSDVGNFYQEIPRLIGPTNYSFPRDDGWLLNGNSVTLGSITIKLMTKKTGKLRDAPPNCQKAWRKRLGPYMRGRPLPWKLIWRSISTYFTTHRDELTWLKLTHRALAVANRFDPHTMCFACKTVPESMLHLCECAQMHSQYWDFFFNLIQHMGFELPEQKPVFLATRCYSSKCTAPEEVIGIFSIAWRCLYAEITKSRLERHVFISKGCKKKSRLHDSQQTGRLW